MSMYEEGVFSNTPPPQARLIADNVAESVSQDHDMVILRVRPEPSDARVRVINIAPAYRDGMDLEPGSYDIEVTAPGYRTFRGGMSRSLAIGRWTSLWNLSRIDNQADQRQSRRGEKDGQISNF
jgi:hypothetical protein